MHDDFVYVLQETNKVFKNEQLFHGISHPTLLITFINIGLSGARASDYFVKNQKKMQHIY